MSDSAEKDARLRAILDKRYRPPLVLSIIDRRLGFQRRSERQRLERHEAFQRGVDAVKADLAAALEGRTYVFPPAKGNPA